MKKRFYEYDVLCGAMHDVVLGNGAKHRCIDAGMILDLQKADVVEVVRCKDCKYCDSFPNKSEVTMPLKCLSIRYGGVFPDWFCEHGERRIDE